jgi:radical SAM superfamily enzyme YgiQ (UPF0313 family)
VSRVLRSSVSSSWNLANNAFTCAAQINTQTARNVMANHNKKAREALRAKLMKEAGQRNPYSGVDSGDKAASLRAEKVYQLARLSLRHAVAIEAQHRLRS